MATDNKPNDFWTDLSTLLSKMWALRVFYLKVWVIVFVLSCVWVLAIPRTYRCEVELAPEDTDNNMGSISSIASSFGLNVGSNSSDAIYPRLYPDLMKSNEFIVDIMGINVKTLDGSIDTDYYTYLSQHLKKNWITQPFISMKRFIYRIIRNRNVSPSDGVKEIDPFMLSYYDYELALLIKKNIVCSVDKRTNVITISVTDQDKLICATLADSVRQLLQQYITDYRTKKACVDAMHYKALADSTKIEYDKAMERYTSYSDSHRNAALQSSISERDKLQKDMEMKYSTYRGMVMQYELMQGKVQEHTPAFTVLKSASVPVRAAGPKRVRFVLSMLVLSTILATFWKLHKELLEWF